MLRSMTGFGKGEASFVEGQHLVVEVSSVNRKQLEVRTAFPPELVSQEIPARKMVQEYVQFIDETGTKNFALNIDFSVFRTKFDNGEWRDPAFSPNVPEDIIPLLPYVACCHAKYFHVDENFQETHVPYEEILNILKEHNWDGYLLSEYEGADKYEPGYEVGQMLRRHHILMKNILGD